MIWSTVPLAVFGPKLRGSACTTVCITPLAGDRVQPSHLPEVVSYTIITTDFLSFYFNFFLSFSSSPSQEISVNRLCQGQTCYMDQTHMNFAPLPLITVLLLLVLKGSLPSLCDKPS
jgi:hypothetical protein